MTELKSLVLEILVQAIKDKDTNLITALTQLLSILLISDMRH